MTKEPQWLAVGRITRAHGTGGEVALQSLSEVESRFVPGSRLYVGESVERVLTVRSVRGPHRGRLLVGFEEVRDRDQAEALAGDYLFVPAAEAPPLPEGEFWPHQILGCEVVTGAGRSLGRIREIIRGPANDVWAAEGDGGEILIPALKDVVERVDLQARKVVVRELAGLTTP